MRKIVVYELVSLDGVAESPMRFFPNWDEALDANLEAVIAAQDAVILGRQTYAEWSQFWPPSDIEPFATFINGVPKYIATSTPLDRDWSNAAIIEGNVVDFARALKQQPGRDIGVHGSIDVAQALFAGNVVDELKLVIAPHLIASGRRLFDGVPPTALQLVRSAISPGGNLIADYRITP